MPDQNDKPVLFIPLHPIRDIEFKGLKQSDMFPQKNTIQVNATVEIYAAEFKPQMLALE
jgi:hypothetical protein